VPDMLVRLYDLPEKKQLVESLKKDGVEIFNALSPNKDKVVNWVRNNFNKEWANECEVAFYNKPVSCFIAVKEKEVVGFASYDSTYKDFFGPTGVSSELRGKGIGKALLLECLYAMREQGYAYAIIGGVGNANGFYAKAANAKLIEESDPGIYAKLI
jgi:GNAT superfamily N-acetyltransferase